MQETVLYLPRRLQELERGPYAATGFYKAVDRLPGIKKSFIGSGVRYDLLLHRYADESLNKAAQTYTEELIARHVSGRLKVAPEHTQDEVLKQMRKPSFSQFGQFKKIFDKVNRQYGLNQQLIPYFISSHPGCTEADMAELAVITKSLISSWSKYKTSRLRR